MLMLKMLNQPSKQIAEVDQSPSLSNTREALMLSVLALAELIIVHNSEF